MPSVPSQNLVKCLAILICVAALAACAGKPVAPGTRYVVSAPKAPFFKYGPAQTFGPDFVLTQGTRVTMLQKSFGFSRVMTDDGIGGYVASDEIKPAPPEPPSSSGGSGSRSLVPSSGAKRSNGQPTGGAPRLDMTDLPFPLPEHSEPPKPSPPFKY